MNTEIYIHEIANKHTVVSVDMSLLRHEASPPAEEQETDEEKEEKGREDQEK